MVSSKNPSENPFVSIIIPVLNDYVRLQKCLEALNSQTYPNSLYEIIIVDNGSSSDSYSHLLSCNNIRFTQEKRLGSYAARNRGISLSKGEIIAFTDSDCIPTQDWIEQGVKQVTNIENCGLIAGKIEIFYADPDSPTLVEMYEKVSAFPQKKYAEQYRFGATANVFTKSSIFSRVGYFNNSLRSGGDREWGERVAKQGYGVYYAKQVRVLHPARKNIEDFDRKIIRQTSGMLDINSSQPKSLSNIFHAVKIWSFYILPSPRITGNIFTEATIDSVKYKIQLLIFMLFIRTLRLYYFIALKLEIKTKKY